MNQSNDEPIFKQLNLTDEISADIFEIMGEEESKDISSSSSSSPSQSEISASEEIIKLSLLEQSKAEASSLSRAINLSDSIAKSPDFVNKTAYRIYTAIHSSSQSFLRKYCEANALKQIWKRNSLNAISIVGEFNPLVYSIYTRKFATLSEGEECLIANQNTPEEAVIQASYRVGYLVSLDYKSLLGRFPLATIEELQKNPSILQRVREHLKLEEYKKQITQKKVLFKYRDKWLEDIEREILLIKGAL